MTSFASSLVFFLTGSARSKSLTVEQALGGKPRGPGRLKKHEQTEFNRAKAVAAAKEAQQQAEIRNHNRKIFKPFHIVPASPPKSCTTSGHTGNTERAVATASASVASQTPQLISPTKASRVSSSHAAVSSSRTIVLIFYSFAAVWTLVVICMCACAC